MVNGILQLKSVLRKIVISSLSGRALQFLDKAFLRNRAAILMLHRFSVPDLGIAGHDPVFVRDALETLRRRRLNIISLRSLYDRIAVGEEIEPGTVVFSMDDGFWDQAEIGAELFYRYDCPATLFAISGFVDGANWPWDDRVAWILSEARKGLQQLTVEDRTISLDTRCSINIRSTLQAVRSHCKRLDGVAIESLVNSLATALDVEVPLAPPRQYQPMSWDQARALETKGIDFGPHTVNHYILSRLDDATAQYEIQTAWQRLLTELDHPLNVYAWPTGRYSDFGTRDIKIAQSIGMRGAVATNDNYANITGTATSSFCLDRFSMPMNHSDLLQYTTWIERAKQLLRNPFAHPRSAG